MSAPVTVVVPSYGRPGRVRRCLQALARLDYPDCRVVIVDDGSPEPIAPIAAPFGERVRVIRQANAGPARARNAGVAAASTELIAFTDDDCEPGPGWLHALVAAHARDPGALVGGRTVNGLPDNAFSSASQALVDYLYAYNGERDAGSAFFTTNNLLFSRSGFEAVGGLDASFTEAAAEDRELCLRWRRSGRALRYAPDAVVAHAHDLTLGGFWRQHAAYGAGAYRLHRVLDAGGDARPKREPARFYSGILLHPWRSGAPAPLGQSALLGLSQVAMVAGYLAGRRRGRAGADAPGGGVPPGGPSG